MDRADDRLGLCGSVLSRQGNPLRGRPEQVRVGLDGLRSLPQLVSRDRRATMQAGACHVPCPPPYGCAVPSCRHESHPRRSPPISRGQNSVGPWGQSQGPTVVGRRRLWLGRVGRRGSEASAHRGVDHGDRMRQRAEAVKAAANRRSRHREAVALTAEHAAARLPQDRPLYRTRQRLSLRLTESNPITLSCRFSILSGR